MTRARHAVPLVLQGRPFLTGDALAAGVSRDALAGSTYRSLFTGVHAEANLEVTLGLRCDGARLLLPTQAAFSHWTAAGLLGLPVPGGADSAVQVTIPAPLAVPKVRHLCGHSRLLADADVTEVEGRRVTTAERTFLDLSARTSLAELVVLADAACAAGRATPDSLSAAVDGWSKRRGVVRARDAVTLVEPKSESPMETRTRLVLVLGGLPRPEAQVNLFDAYGQWVARCDLCYRDARVVIEYDGADHLTKGRFAADLDRVRRIEEAGYIVLRFAAQHIYGQPAYVVATVRRALERSGWLRQAG